MVVGMVGRGERIQRMYLKGEVDRVIIEENWFHARVY